MKHLLLGLLLFIGCNAFSQQVAVDTITRNGIKYPVYKELPNPLTKYYHYDDVMNDEGMKRLFKLYKHDCKKGYVVNIKGIEYMLPKEPTLGGFIVWIERKYRIN